MLFCVSEGVPSGEVQRVRGVRLAPEAQEGSAVSHSRGVSRLDACVPSQDPQPSTLSILNRSIRADASATTAGMGGRKLVNVILLA